MEEHNVPEKVKSVCWDGTKNMREVFGRIHFNDRDDRRGDWCVAMPVENHMVPVSS